MFVLHWQGKEPKDNKGFKISTQGKNSSYITEDLKLSSKKDDGVVLFFEDKGNGKGHEIKNGKKSLSMSKDGEINWVDSDATTFKIFSVTY